MTASVSDPPGAYPDEPVLAAGERSAWWLALGASLLGVAIGVMMVAWPAATLQVVAALFGIWLLVHGVVRIVQAISGRGRDGAGRALLGVIGLFFVVAGVVALRNLLVSPALVITLIGLMWLIGGLVELVTALAGPGGGGHRLGRAALGVLSIGAGLVVLVWPGLSLRTLVAVTGLWLIVMGLVQVGLVLWTRRALTGPAR